MRFALPLAATLIAAACSSATTPAPSDDPAASHVPTAPSGAGSASPVAPPPADGDAGAADASQSSVQTNGFPAKWIDGTACATDPKIQTWALTADTFILRQSLCTNFEGPFMYLMVGSTKALLVDTGTGGVDLRGAVMTLLGGKAVDLVVAHSHGHGDHVSGDGGFRGQPKTTVVGADEGTVHQFFGLNGDAPSAFDLGGRVVDVLAIPGHQEAHVAYYDHETHVLLTGDTLYPGRLYVDDWDAYKNSVPRLAAFIDATRPVSFILGGHIELPATGADYAYGATKHANEHVLQLAESDLRELASAVKALGDDPRRDVHANFIIDP